MADSTYMASIYRLEATVFRDSARRLNVSFEADGQSLEGNRMALPVYYLVSHAAELFLKAALFKRGVTDDDLKKYTVRHSLNALRDALQAKGLCISSEAIQILDGLNAQHESHALRYTALVDNGRKLYMPPPALAFAMLDELLLLTRVSTQGV
jgi:hypothetical protein